MCVPSKQQHSRRRLLFKDLPRIATVLSCLACGLAAASAQIQTGPIKPQTPSQGFARPLVTPMVSDADDRNKSLHRDSIGRPCLQFTAESRSQPATPTVFDHVVAVNNRCLQQIKVKLCYYKSSRCFMVDLTSNQRKETILGTFTAMRYFRYEYQEQK